MPQLQRARLVCLNLFLSASLAQAQSVPSTRLKPTNAVSSEEFTSIYATRELADGRLLVTESGPESQLVVISFESNTATKIGRMGRGPGEFEHASGLYALGGDSTLMTSASKQWLVLVGARIAAKSKPDDPAAVALSGLNGADRLGFLLTALPSTWQDDSSSIGLVSRATGKRIEVARLSLQVEPGYPVPTRLVGNVVTYPSGAWLTYEAARLFPDGWLAVARLSPYRVDWRDPQGRWTLGAPLPVPPIKADDREKRAYMERIAAERGGAGRATFEAWPKNVPPFSFRVIGLVGTPDGKLLIPRTRTADHPEARYDIIDRTGRLEGQVILKSNERILEIGARSVYVAVTDDDGIVRIQRHPWP